MTSDDIRFGPLTALRLCPEMIDRALGEKEVALREARVLRIEKEDLKDQLLEHGRKLDEVRNEKSPHVMI